ncbi:RHOMBOID-like protein 4, partial [Bienertia sinuspersici]
MGWEFLCGLARYGDGCSALRQPAISQVINQPYLSHCRQPISRHRHLSAPQFFLPHARLDKMRALVMDKIVHKNQGWSLISCIASFPCAGQHVRFISYWKEYKWGENLVLIGLLYAIAGLGGSVISGLFGRSNIFVGASCADFKFYPIIFISTSLGFCAFIIDPRFYLIIFYLIEVFYHLILPHNTLPHRGVLSVASLLMLALIVVVNLGVGILPNVGNFAHKGARNVCHQALIQEGQTTRYISVPCGSFRLL